MGRVGAGSAYRPGMSIKRGSLTWERIHDVMIDSNLDGAGAVSDERGDFIACFDLPTIGESAQRRVDAAILPT